MQNAYNQIYQFQFHKGTIRTVGSTIAGGYQANFNSIKVQLEPGLISGAGSLIGFQFHKGTIRTFRLCYLGKTISNFNSIKVQLERLLSISILVLRHFNSIKVQLEQRVISD